jgi:hypothetical protein
MENERMIELFEYYAEIVEKQEQIILNLGLLVKKQAIELSHLRNFLNAEPTEASDELVTAQEMMLEYESMKTGP